MKHTLTFLGTSTSVGIPVIGCDCPRCTSTDPKVHRMRSSIVIESEEQTILVDAGPDLRHQALRHQLVHIDCVLYTHGHLDHIAGFDELRAFCWRREDLLPLYGNKDCIETLQQMYAWAFSKKNTYKGYVRPVARQFDGPFEMGSMKIQPILVNHGSITTHGFKFITDEGAEVVYIPDVKSIPEASYALIGAPDILIIDCLREQEHPAHMSVKESLAAVERISPAEAYFTHCSHEMDCVEVAKTLPNHVSFSYDTQSLFF